MDMSLSKLQEMVKDREAWCAESVGSQCQTGLSDWTTMDRGNHMYKGPKVPERLCMEEAKTKQNKLTAIGA